MLLGRKNSYIRIGVVIVVVLLIVFSANAILHAVVQGHYRQAGQLESFQNIHSTFGYTRDAFVTETHTHPFILHESVSTRFVLWSKTLTGTVHLSILDANHKVVHSWQGRDLNVAEEIQLQAGKYTVELTLSFYSGSLKFGLNDVQFVIDLPADRYSYIEALPTAGFYWDYILYVPEQATAHYLLVIPNNTGYEENDMIFHREAAKNLIQNMSTLADDLGTPLLVPVFPRPAGELEQYYTHNLDRNALLMDIDGYQRLDLQLLAMVDDARNKLTARQIQTEPRFLMWGFSASGTFTDRFSLLHPDRLVAVAASGTHSLPFATYGGENLPYPVGTYDYETITGTPFDIQEFASLPRFLYKGDQDSGGTITDDTGVYPADEYFDLFIRSDLEAKLKTAPQPLITGTVMSQSDEDLLKYRIYDGAVFVDEFKAIERIYAEAGLDKSCFKLYPGVGHTITNEMTDDVREFFLAFVH